MGLRVPRLALATRPRFSASAIAKFPSTRTRNPVLGDSQPGCDRRTLESCGWEVIEACGGVSVIAKPSGYLSKSIKLEKDGSTWKAKLNDTNIRDSMLRATGLCINGPSWTGIPGYCRFMLALEDGDFDRALDCIAKFKQIVK